MSTLLDEARAPGEANDKKDLGRSKGKSGAKPRTKGKSGSKGGSGRRPALVLAVIAACLVLVGVFLVYWSNPGIQSAIGNAGESARNAVEDAADAVARVVSHDPVEEGAGNKTDGDKPASRVGAKPMEREKQDVLPKTSQGEQNEKPAPVSPLEQAASTHPIAIPDPEIVDLTLRQAQKVALAAFGGSVSRTDIRKDEGLYDIVLATATARLPFAAPPVHVRVQKACVKGHFVSGRSGFLVFVDAVDPDGPEWTSEYAGVLVFDGPPEAPGNLMAMWAQQAPRARFTRQEVLDMDGDSRHDLVVEVEYSAAGGYTYRDLDVISFAKGKASSRFSVRTLEDGAGIPLEVVSFKDVKLVDNDKDGKMELSIGEGKRHYKILPGAERELIKVEKGKTKIQDLTAQASVAIRE